jgi:hypothetical protein
MVGRSDGEWVLRAWAQYSKQSCAYNRPIHPLKAQGFLIFLRQAYKIYFHPFCLKKNHSPPRYLRSAFNSLKTKTAI